MMSGRDMELDLTALHQALAARAAVAIEQVGQVAEEADEHALEALGRPVADNTPYAVEAAGGGRAPLPFDAYLDDDGFLVFYLPNERIVLLNGQSIPVKPGFFTSVGDGWYRWDNSLTGTWTIFIVLENPDGVSTYLDGTWPTRPAHVQWRLTGINTGIPVPDAGYGWAPIGDFDHTSESWLQRRRGTINFVWATGDTNELDYYAMGTTATLARSIERDPARGTMGLRGFRGTGDTYTYDDEDDAWILVKLSEKISGQDGFSLRYWSFAGLLGLIGEYLADEEYLDRNATEALWCNMFKPDDLPDDDWDNFDPEEHTGWHCDYPGGWPALISRLIDEGIIEGFWRTGDTDGSTTRGDLIKTASGAAAIDVASNDLVGDWNSQGTFQADGGFKAGDGTAGATEDVVVGGVTLHFKDGLYVGKTV